MNYMDIAIPNTSKFLVTGGAGFIGSNIVSRLLEMGYEVRVLDNFSTGKEANIREFYNMPNFQLIQGDIRDLDVCLKASKDIDYILHQAALGSVPRSIEDPQTTNEVNVSGTLNMLIAAKENEIKRFVYASSSSVYGDEEMLPKKEGNIGRQLSPYAITKYINELYAYNFYYLYGLETIGLRYFNVYGSKQDPDSIYAAVIPNFINQLLNNQKSIIYGDGTQSRDFTYIEDVIQANIKACASKKGALGEVFNVASGRRITINKLHNIICDLLKKEVSPIYGPTRKGDVKHSLADIEKARDTLKYIPVYGIEDGLKISIKWYQDQQQYSKSGGIKNGC